MNLIEKLRHYANGMAILKDWLGSDPVPVEKPVAQARANVCLECPMNQHGIRLTDFIADEIKKQIELKNHLELHVDGEQQLETCTICDCVNRLQIWCPEKLFQFYTRADAIRYPVFCWKRKLIEKTL